MSGFPQQFLNCSQFSPILHDAELYWRMWDKFVSDYLDVTYPQNQIQHDSELKLLLQQLPNIVPGTENWILKRETIQKMCTTLLYASSAGHEIVGGLSSVMYGSPFVISPNIQMGYTVKDRMPNIYQCIRAYGLALITTIRTFNVKQDMSYLALSTEEKQVLDSLTKRIEEIDLIINQRNSTGKSKMKYYYQKMWKEA